MTQLKVLIKINLEPVIGSIKLDIDRWAQLNLTVWKG